MGQILTKQKNDIKFQKMSECTLCKQFFSNTKKTKENICYPCKKTLTCDSPISPLSHSIFYLSSDSDAE